MIQKYKSVLTHLSTFRPPRVNIPFNHHAHAAVSVGAGAVLPALHSLDDCSQMGDVPLFTEVRLEL